MKKTAPYFLICAFLLIALFFAGPRTEVDTTLHALALTEPLDDYLNDSEAQFSDITEGAEKSILWANVPNEATPYSIIYLHGFSATWQETAPLTEMVGQTLEANVFNTRFTGHGRSGEAMAEASVNAWLNDGYEAMEIGRAIGEKVIVIGTSTGGTVATWLAANNAEDLAALILISPNFGPKDSNASILNWPWGKQLAELIVGPERQWEAENELQEKYWTTRYPTAGLLPMMATVSLVQQQALENIQVPVLLLHSENDQVVNPEKIEQAFARFGSSVKSKIVVTDSTDPSQHVIAGDILSPNTTDDLAREIVDFIVHLQ